MPISVILSSFVEIPLPGPHLDQWNQNLGGLSIGCTVPQMFACTVWCVGWGRLYQCFSDVTCTQVTWVSCFWGSAFLTSELVLLPQEPLWAARLYNKWYQVHGGLREHLPTPKIHQEVCFPVLSQIISDKCVSLVHFKFDLEKFALQGEEKDKNM